MVLGGTNHRISSLRHHNLSRRLIGDTKPAVEVVSEMRRSKLLFFRNVASFDELLPFAMRWMETEIYGAWS